MNIQLNVNKISYKHKFDQQVANPSSEHSL
jgi:hypothetical protein